MLPRAVRTTRVTKPPWRLPRSSARESELVPLEAGAFVGRYVVREVLGRGSMGTVYRAEDPRLDRAVALKVIEVGAHDPPARMLAQQRGLREAMAMAQLSHPNVLPVYDVGEYDGQVYLTMELVEGQTLREWLEQGVRSPDECLGVFIAAGRGLAAAHAAGLVHRDFKPDNVLVGDDGRVRVMDFGLVFADAEAVAEELARDPSISMLSSIEERLTETHSVMGTPAYMSGEQFRGGPIGPAADQFAFCVALFEALYGVRPFAGDTLSELAKNVGRGCMVPVDRGVVPLRLGRVIRRGLAARPEERHPSMATLVRRLESSRRRSGRVAGLLAVLMVGVGLGATGLVSGRSGPRTARCDAIPSTSWLDRRGAVERRFGGLELGYARTSFDRIAPRLDRYAERWTQAYARACDAGQAGDRAAPAVMRCLERRRVQLDALVATLERADAAVAEHAVEAVEALDSVDECDRAVRTEAPPPPASLAGQVARVREELAEIEAQRHAGRYTAARADLEALVETTRTLGYEPLHAEALQSLARLRSDTGAPADAEAPLVEAIHLAQAAEYGQLVASAAIELTVLLGEDLARAEEALDWGRHAEAEVVRLGSPPRLLGDLRATMGIVYTRLDRLPEARTQLQRALELRRERRGDVSRGVASVLLNLGNVEFEAGNRSEAIALYRRVLELQGQIYGDDHPAVALTLHNLGLACRDVGQGHEARAHLERALAIREQAFGPVHPEVAATLNAVAIVDVDDGRFAEALARQQRAFEILRAVYDDEHPLLAIVANELGTAYFRADRRDEALRHYEDARRRWERALGPTRPEVAVAEYNMGMVAQAQGRLEPAREHLARAVEIRRAAAAPPPLAKSLLALGNVERELGNVNTAAEHLTRALELREGEPAPPAELAEARFALARVLVGRERERAVGLAQQALRDYQEAGQQAGQQAEHQVGPAYAEVSAEITRWLDAAGERASIRASVPR